MLGLKVEGLTEMERECVLTRDETALSVEAAPGKRRGALQQDVMLPSHTGAARRASIQRPHTPVH